MILYLGTSADFDRYTAQVVRDHMRLQHGNRGLIVVWPTGTC